MAAALQMPRSEGVKEVKVMKIVDDFGRSIANAAERMSLKKAYFWIRPNKGGLWTSQLNLKKISFRGLRIQRIFIF